MGDVRMPGRVELLMRERAITRHRISKTTLEITLDAVCYKRDLCGDYLGFFVLLEATRVYLSEYGTTVAQSFYLG
jgi:hypothetical protein